MVISLKERSICENCLNKTCSFVDAVVKRDFFDIRTETTVCPSGVLLDGPDMDAPKISDNDNCVQCGICVKSCSQNNIACNIAAGETCSYSSLTEQQLNAIAGTYLNAIIGFAANTNRNKAMLFDGYAVNKNGIKMFVEVDWNNDSLECTRRLLGDFLTDPSKSNINTGIVILQNLPKRGTHDVFDLLAKLTIFPTTTDVKIYFTTFEILRLLYLSLDSFEFNMDILFHNPLKENTMEYISRINRLLGGEVII